MRQQCRHLECSGITLAPDGGTFVVVLTATTATDSTNCGLIENTAMLTAGGKGEASASTNVECTQAPCTIVKECPSGDQLDGARVGDSIIYKVTITNDGNVDLTDVVVTDTRVGGAFYSDSAGTVASDFSTTLAAGASETRYYKSTITQADADAGNVNNSATVSTAELDDVTDDTPLCSFTPISKMEVTKTCPTEIPAGLRVGVDTISYDVTIRNTGDTPLTNIVVTEPRAGTFAPVLPDPFTLGVGESYIGTFTTTVTQADADAGTIDNTISAVSDEVTTPVEATADCPFVPETGFTVEKQCPDTSGLAVGDTIYYPIVITNTGDVAVSIAEPVDSVRPGGTFYDDASGASPTAFPLSIDPGYVGRRSTTRAPSRPPTRSPATWTTASPSLARS